VRSCFFTAVRAFGCNSARYGRESGNTRAAWRCFFEEEAAFKNAARHVLELTDEQLAALIRNAHFSEVDDDDQAVP
jgi:hypothetical protein